MNMNTIGRADSLPVSSSGNDGSSQAAASIAGTTVMAPNHHAARLAFAPACSWLPVARSWLSPADSGSFTACS